MKILYFFLFLLVFTVVSCGSEGGTKEKVCSPSCKFYEECKDGVCTLKENSCRRDTDCASTDVCNLSTHLCELSACNPKCEGWETCDKDTGECKTSVGRCGEDSFCLRPEKPVCNEMHYCVAPSNNCNKPCEKDEDCGSDDICDPFDKVCQTTSSCDSSWQYCYEAECHARIGFCENDSQCTQEGLNICDTEDHICIAQETACNPACDSWQQCNNDKQCVTAPGFCAVDQDCVTSPSKPICDQRTHVCSSEEITFLQPVTLQTKGVIITRNNLKSKFEELAKYHTMTGTPVEVVTIEDICGTRNCNDSDKTSDTTFQIKEYLKTRNDIKYVLLGGDIEIVPSRQVHDEYHASFTGGYNIDVNEDFYTDYYYADMQNWDSNNNGVYAEDSDNLGDYRPEKAVSRLSVSDLTELSNYIDKLKIYLFDYDRDVVEYALFLSNVATSITVPAGQYSTDIDIDGAQYFEMEGRTVNIIEQNSVGADVDFMKLYHQRSSDWGAKQLQCDGVNQCNIIWAIEGDGPREFGNGDPNLVIHMGHGGVHTLMVEQKLDDNGNPVNKFDGNMAYNLKNDIPNIFLSCACQAGTFSASDSAGEMLVNAPDGGAILYLGDSSIGLGLAGGAQFIDEFVKYFYNNKNIIAGDSIFAAHKNMPTSDRLTMPILNSLIGNFMDSPITVQSYEWTQKVATFLGDLFIPIYNAPRDYLPSVTISQGALQNFPNASDLYIRGNSRFPENTQILILTDSGNYYEIDLSNQDGVVKEFDEKPTHITYGIYSPDAFPIYGEKDFN